MLRPSATVNNALWLRGHFWNKNHKDIKTPDIPWCTHTLTQVRLWSGRPICLRGRNSTRLQCIYGAVRRVVHFISSCNPNPQSLCSRASSVWLIIYGPIYKHMEHFFTVNSMGGSWSMDDGWWWPHHDSMLLISASRTHINATSKCSFKS